MTGEGGRERGTLGARGWRRWAPRLLFAVVVVGQLLLIHRAYTDPHKRFGFQPYNESDTIEARIVRVTVDGRRVPVTRSWAGYRWDDLVRSRGLNRIHRLGHASSGARSVTAFLAAALDWVADHTPRDRETLRYEAHVTYYHNTRGPFTVDLIGKERDVAALRPGADGGGGGGGAR